MLPPDCQMTRPPLGPNPTQPSPTPSLLFPFSGTHKSQQARQIYETTLYRETLKSRPRHLVYCAEQPQHRSIKARKPRSLGPGHCLGPHAAS